MAELSAGSPCVNDDIAVGQSTSIWTKNFLLLCLANISAFVSMQMLIPTLPLYLLHIGGRQSDVGYVMGSYTIGAMLMRISAGWLVDRYARKNVLIAGIVLMLATTLLYQLATDIPHLTAIRLLHGVTFGLVSTAMATMVVDGLPPARMSEGIGCFGLTANLSMSVAPMLGLWLLGAYDYHVVFFSMSAFVAVSVVFCLSVMNTSARTAGYTRSSAAAALPSLLEKTAVLPSVMAFFLSAVFSAVLFFIALYAAKLGIANAGLFFLAMALSMLMSRPISGHWSDVGGTNMVMTIGHLALLLGIVLIVFSRGMALYLAAGVFMGIGFGFSFPILQTLAVRYAPAHRRGAATGTFFLACDIGIGLGAILWGYVAEVAGYHVMYGATLAPLALAAGIYVLFRSRMAPPKWCG